MTTKIKMSDIFELPMQQGEHELFLLDSNNVYICETEYDNQAKAVKIAINAYDANQERIVEFEKLSDEQQVMLNFQSAQHNVMVELGLKRERKIINLKRQISGLKDEIKIERDPGIPMVIIAEKLG